ncbi:MAG: hypothetical protein KC561_03320, partial [Myxococcales bacterium]|nr:hypothetical protein [Myxococcales bacterium]
SSKQEAVTVKYGENLMNCNFVTDTVGQVSEVRVLAWAEKDKSQVIGKATDGDVTQKLGESKVGPKVAKDIFGDCPYWVSGFPANSQAEADEAAKAIMNEIAMRFMRVEADVMGTPDLVAGSVIKFEGCTKHFDGKYYVTQAIHRYEIGSGSRGGYLTHVLAERPAWSV